MTHTMQLGINLIQLECGVKRDLPGPNVDSRVVLIIIVAGGGSYRKAKPYNLRC